MGVTGAAEESRYNKTDHPRHSYLGRVCSFSSFRGEGGRLQPGRQLRGVDPGKQSTQTPKLSTAQVMLMDGRHFKATSCYAQVAIPMGSMMIRVRLTQA